VIAILCSGQGRQHADMFRITGDAPEASALFVHATTLLGSDPRSWVRSAGEDALHRDRTAQLLCTLQALSAAAVLADLIPQRRCLAGYSVGEVAAWSIAGMMADADALNLVAQRADAMDAAKKSEQGMLFIRGLPRAAIDALCAGCEAAIAIVNPGDAWVLGGRRSALDAIAIEAVHRGASRVVPVPVHVASHTYLMADASPVFRGNLAAVRFQPAPRAGSRLISSIDGTAVFDTLAGLDKLASQISHPVQWARCLASCVEAGARAFFELGPGHALADMVTGSYPGIMARSFDDFRSLQGVRTWLRRVTANG
jgi:[acyl-carrier-protein] S-malonyltransferase